MPQTLRMRLLAAAKINLHLRVGPLQDDGFHPLLTWMVTVGLFDTLTIEADDRVALDRATVDRATVAAVEGASESVAPAVHFSCDDAALPTDERNLVVRAAHRLWTIGMNAQDAARPTTRVETRSAGSSTPSLRPVRITLEKRVPSGGGLGGGSSDAAATLLALDRFWNLNLGVDRLASIAAELGSDVPFFLYGPSSICQGRGEVVQPIAPPRAKWAVLMFPPIAMPTAQVYREFDSMIDRGSSSRNDDDDPPHGRHVVRTAELGKACAVNDQPPWQEWQSLSADSLLPRLVNDLEPPAFAIRRELGELRAQIEWRLGRIVRMSGSGSTLFTLFDEKGPAEIAAQKVTSEFGTASSAVEIAPEIKDDC